MKKIVIAVVIWLAALYCAQASTLFFKGIAGSGGPTMGHAETTSCARNWWAFGALWSCDATIVGNDGQRHPYHSDKSVLTPTDIGKQVPMTYQRARSSGSSAPTFRWAPTESVDGNRVANVLGLLGFPGIALFVTFRLFRDKKPVK